MLSCFTSLIFHNIYKLLHKRQFLKEFTVILYSEQIHLLSKRNDIKLLTKYTKQSWFQIFMP